MIIKITIYKPKQFFGYIIGCTWIQLHPKKTKQRKVNLPNYPTTNKQTNIQENSFSYNHFLPPLPFVALFTGDFMLFVFTLLADKAFLVGVARFHLKTREIQVEIGTGNCILFCVRGGGRPSWQWLSLKAEGHHLQKSEATSRQLGHQSITPSHGFVNGVSIYNRVRIRI